MDPAALMLGCLLLAQGSVAPMTGAELEASPAARASAAEIVATVFAVPDSGALAGRPVTLLEALASARDRARQLAVVHKYWRLSEAVGQYAAYREGMEHLRRLQPRGADGAAVRNARTSALAALQQAEATAVAAQRDLADAAVLAMNLPLPLPADAPHVGPYSTRFDELYATRGVSPRARLIHRSLPVRREAIDRRVQAVTAADYAAESAVTGYGSGEADLAVVMGGIADLARQRRALVAAVAQYNRDIVDYVLMVVDPPPSGPVLVSMLIKSSPETAPPAAAPQGPTGIMPPLGTFPLDKQGALAEPSGVQPAKFVEPRYGWPGGPAEGVPTLAPPKERASPTPPPSGPTSDRPRTFVPQAPDDTSPPNAAGAEPLGVSGSQAAARTVRRANADLADFSAAGPPATSPLYVELSGLLPGAQTKRLSEALHAARTLPSQGGQPIELKDYLRTPVGGDRRGAIEAYWLAAQRAAECRALDQQLQWLRQLGPLALDRGAKPGGSGQMLRLHAVQRASEADLLDAQASLLEAQFELTRRSGRPLDAAWLVSATPPHAGPYDLKLNARPRDLVQSRAVRRLAAVIPTIGESIKDDASAVVEGDAARAAAAAAYSAGTGSTDQLLPCIRCQTAQTLAFLNALTGYNRAIAEYVLLVLDPAIPADQLVQTLVVSR